MEFHILYKIDNISDIKLKLI